MKRARILLAIIMLFAIAGGTLAFKANRGVLIVFKKNAAGTACTRLPGLYRVNPAYPIVTGVFITSSSTGTSLPTGFCSAAIRLEYEE